MFKRYDHYTPDASGVFVLIALLVLGAIIGNLISLPFSLLWGGKFSELAMLIAYPVMFVPLLVYAKAKSRRSEGRTTSVPLDSNNFGRLGAFLCAILVILGTICASFCTDALSSLMPAMPKWLEEALKSMTQGTLWVNFISVCILAPLLEEWLCRGMILRGFLANGVRPWLAIVLSALFFALIHLNPWQAIPAFALGCLFGFVYYKTGSLKLTMLMHLTNNLTALVISHVPALEDADNWREVIPGPQYWFIFSGALLLLALVVLKFCQIPKRES